MIESVSIPVSTCAARARFLRGCLHSLHAHSRRRHEVVVCTEDPVEAVQAIVAEWEESLPSWPSRLSWKSRLEVRVVHVEPWQLSGLELGSAEEYRALCLARGYQAVDRRYAAGHNPLYQMLLAGVVLATRPFVCTPAGDDSYFPPGWEALLDAVDPAMSRREVWIPRYVFVEPRTRRDFVDAPECVFPREGDDEIAESALLAEIERRRGFAGVVVREPIDLRSRVMWPHGVMSRELFATVGGYRTLPPYPHAQDLQLHQDLARLGVTSVGVHSSVVVNSKVPVRIGA